MKISKKYYILIIVIVLLLFGFWLGQGIFVAKESRSETETLFVIEKGQSLADIASSLEKEGLIKSRFLFEFCALLLNLAKKLQAGKYNLTASMNIPQMLAKLVQGDTIKEKITIQEGWSLKDIGWYFENKGMFQAEEIFEITGFPGVDYSKASDLPQPRDFSDEFDFLKEKPKNISLEGYLFPDTYEITPDSSIEAIVRKMLSNFEGKINSQLREEVERQGKTLSQVLIMASLLEDEMQSYEDRQIAAGIFWKRLKWGWPLQVDATLTYLTGKSSGELTKEDLKIDSPYNTYKYYGLPIGPICNPGLEAIKAAIYYKESPFWFYLTTPEGETIFSRTLWEHNVARAKYLK